MKQILVELEVGESLARQMAEVRAEWESGAFGALVLRICSGRDAEEYTLDVARGLKCLFPQAFVVGTMSAGEIKDGCLMPQGVLVGAMLFEDTRIQARRYDRVQGNEDEAGRRMCADLERIEDVKAVELLLPGTELDTRVLFERLSASPKGIQFFGGYSGGHTMNAQVHFVFDSEVASDGSVIMVAYAGQSLHVDTDKLIGWEALGLPFRVTKASGNRLIELDGRPASEVYERFLRIDRSQSDNAGEGYAFPFMARYKGDAWLRSTIHIEEDGSLDLHGYVIEGMDIQLSYGNSESIVRLVDERLEALRRFKPQAILLYSCIVRKAFWEEYIDMEMEPFAQLCSTMGFHSWGELSRDKKTGELVEHNVTLLSVAMREGEPAAGELPPVHVDDTVLKGPAAQLRRLTNLVYNAMGELQKAHADMRVLNRKLTEMAEHDALTGLYNRGKTEQLIRDALDASQLTRQPVGLVMVDVDHFKQVNDTYGHQAGDAVLQDVAQMIKLASIEYLGAAAGRWGGEEFFLVLPNMGWDEVWAAAEGLRKEVGERRFTQVGHVTISLGALSVVGDVAHNRVYTSVDNALYQAKEQGRNRTVRAELL